MKEDFLTLYKNSFDDIYRYVFFKTGNRWETDDIVSSIYEKAFHRYDQVRGNPRAWLFTIARNSITDSYRARKDTTWHESTDRLPYIDENFNSLEDQETLLCLKKSLAFLPSEDRELIKARYFGKLKFRKISELVGNEEGNLRKRASRILQKLRVLMEKCLEGES
ncbi:RNA polymerase sigma factor [Desulfitobacterium sp. THU1]|uniref:RNA polymerase sigma factor n=1 Tax=Desulfitobacterium sp. THU1 TaxID=3138072 RepID=UPI00311DC38D